jgi:hypothetical protein
MIKYGVYYLQQYGYHLFSSIDDVQWWCCIYLPTSLYWWIWYFFPIRIHKVVRNNRKKGHNLIDDLYINGETYSGKENVLQGFTEHFRQLATNNQNNESEYHRKIEHDIVFIICSSMVIICSPAVMICSMVMLYISTDFSVLRDLILFPNSDNVASGIVLFLTSWFISWICCSMSKFTTSRIYPLWFLNFPTT